MRSWWAPAQGRAWPRWIPIYLVAGARRRIPAHGVAGRQGVIDRRLVEGQRPLEFNPLLKYVQALVF